MHLIEVRDVYKIYNPGENQVNALDGVSITIDEGEFVAIIGQSGSGKSTLMNMLGLLDTPTHGEYYINGKLVDDLTDDQMSVIRNEEIGFIFQGFNLISSLSALENVELPLVYRGMPKQERREISQQALERVGLGSRIHHLPAEMSGGQQQRLCIARAMAVSPSVLLMDEPASALDPISTAKVEELIHELKKEYTIVIVTHNMQQAARVSDKTAFFYMGNMVEYDDTKKIFTNPGKEATQNYITGRFG